MDPDPHPTLRENVRALPPATWVLFAGTFVNRLGTFVLPFMTLYLTRRGYSPGQAGLAIAMYGVGGIGSQLVGGWLADRIGRRKAIALSMISASCLTLVLWRATSLAVIYPVMALLATAAEAHRPAASALIADLVPARGRVTAFAMFRLAINIGWAAGLTLGGLLAERSFSYLVHRRRRDVGDVRGHLAPRAAARGSNVAPGAPTARRSNADDPGRPRSAAVPGVGARRLGDLHAERLLVPAARPVGRAFGGRLRRAPGTERRVRRPARGADLQLVAAAVAAVDDRHGRAARGAGFGSLFVARSVPALVAMVFVWTLGEIVSSPVISAFVADRSPDHTRGRFQAALGMVFAFGSILGPGLGTAVFEANADALWIGCGAAGLLSAALALRAGRHPAPLISDLTPPPASG